MNLKAGPTVVFAILATAGCAGQAPSQREASRAVAALTIPAGSFDFALPRVICDSAARVGDTITAAVARPQPQSFPGGLYGIGADTTIPPGLRAFLTVSRVGAATGRTLFLVDLAVDSFVVGRHVGQATVSPLLPDPEGVMGRLRPDRSAVYCYGGRLRGEMSTELTLRPR